jgi:hypothetical protein
MGHGIHRPLYPRIRENDEIIERYRGCIENLPPIIVARGRVLVDGFHRWQAHRREKVETIQAEDLGNLTDVEIFRESIRRNCTHGYQLDEADKKRDAIAIWRSLSHLDDAVRYQEFIDLFSVKKRTVEAWTKDAREEEKEEKKALAWNQWLDCWTDREIAEEVNVDYTTVSRWLLQMRKDAEMQQPPSSRQHFDVWSFGKADDSAGGKIFGRMPAQIVENLLWLYTDVFVL